jgi:hypothetical protein
MSNKAENLLWLRVAALRGVDPGRGARAHVEGDRFQVQVVRKAKPTMAAAGLSRGPIVVNAPGCSGVIGEIVPHQARRSRIPTSRGLGPDWRFGLLEREAERLATFQPDRRTR